MLIEKKQQYWKKLIREGKGQAQKYPENQTPITKDPLNRVKNLQVDFDNYRKLAEEERAHIAAAVDYSEDAIILKTLDGKISKWNNGAERIYGYSAQEMVGKSISLIVPPEHPDDTGLILERIWSGENVVHYETLRRKKDGGLINIALTASPIRDAQNCLIGVSTIAHDITGRKIAEETLGASKMRYRRLFETARAGRTPEELAGKPFMDLLPGVGTTLRLAQAVQQTASGKGRRFEEEHKGTVYDHLVIPIPGPRETMQSIAVFCTYVTYLKDAESQLKEANDQLVQERDLLCTLSAVLDSIDDPVIITDTMGTIVYVNDEFVSKFGYTSPEITNIKISTLADPKNTFDLNEGSFMHDQQSVWTGKFIAMNKYGLSLPFLLKSSPVMKENRLNYRVFVLREDVYDRK